MRPRPSSARRARGPDQLTNGQTTCPPVGWGKTRWVHEPIYKCESNDDPVQCAEYQAGELNCFLPDEKRWDAVTRQAFGERSYMCEGGAAFGAIAQPMLRLGFTCFSSFGL
jgi:hypothetical protein